MNHKTDVLLVTVTEVEKEAVMNVFSNSTGKKHNLITLDNWVYYDLGTVNGTQVFMVQCSRMGSGGSGASYFTVEKAISSLHPTVVIMVGIAFGVNSNNCSIGDISVSDRLALYDLERVGTYVNIHRGSIPDASATLLNYFRSINQDWNQSKFAQSKFNVKFGLVLSGEKVVDNIDFRNRLCDAYPEAIGGEMEGNGLYTACNNAKVDWILVKSICDYADGKKNENREYNQKLAAENAACFVYYMLKKVKIGESEDSCYVSPLEEKAQLIITNLQSLPGGEKRKNELIEIILKETKIEIPMLLKGDVFYTLAITMLNLGLHKSIKILLNLCYHKIDSHNLKLIFIILATSWVNHHAARCVFECALNKEYKPAVLLNACDFHSAKMYIYRAINIPPDRLHIFPLENVYGSNSVDEIVEKIKELLIDLVPDFYDDKKAELQSTLEYLNEQEIPVFIILHYDTNIARLLSDIQNTFSLVTFFLLTGKIIPNQEELKGLRFKFIEPPLEYNVENLEVKRFKHSAGFLRKECYEKYRNYEEY